MSQHISCIPTGVQLGSERYPRKDETPLLKAWRCELTALSQLYNLYFVASNDEVHIYQPSFPTQSLTDEPLFVLRPPASLEAEGAYGIDENDPHSITRLLVTYLGCDEILLMTCDDGDVIGYRIEEIRRTLNQEVLVQSNESHNNIAPHVRHFLHRNVGASAWGLAVHQQGRIIAISANTHEVTVLAYALLSSHSLVNHLEDGYDFDFGSSISKEFDASNDFPLPRRQDHVITLKARTNIPSVSFDNTGSDPGGRWLFSTSIDGKVTVWDLHHSKDPARIIQVGWCVSAQNPLRAPGLVAGYCACPDRANVAHAAWGAMMLDVGFTYSMSAEEESRRTSSVRDGHFLEFTKDKNFFRHRSAESIFNLPLAGTTPFDDLTDDVSDTEMSVDSAEAMSTSGESGSSSLESLYPPQSGTDTELRHENDPVDDQSMPQDNVGMSDHSAPQNSGGAAGAESSMSGEESPEQEESLFIPDTSTNSQLTETQFQQQPASPLTTVLPWFLPTVTDFDTLMDTDSDESDDIEMLMPTTAQAQTLLSRMPQKQPYCEVEDLSKKKDPDLQYKFLSPPNTPCLIFTKEEIFLHQQPLPQTWPQGDTAVPHHQPIKTIRRPLHPGAWLPYLGSFDRICYFTQIPELGIFIIASPVGRAAIFSIYHTNHSDREQLREYGFKLEYILPFVKDKEKDVTSFTHSRLVGIAVSPVQGMFDKPGAGGPDRSDGGGVFHRSGSEDGEKEEEEDDEDEEHDGNLNIDTDQQRVNVHRRWRLLMYYLDHTLISFEIERKRKGGPMVCDLVV